MAECFRTMETRQRGLTFEVTAWFDMSEQEMKEWCENSFIDKYMMFEAPVRKEGRHRLPLNWSELVEGKTRIHLKIVNKTDIMMFKLTWM